MIHTVTWPLLPLGGLPSLLRQQTECHLALSHMVRYLEDLLDPTTESLHDHLVDEREAPDVDFVMMKLRKDPVILFQVLVCPLSLLGRVCCQQT